MAAEIPIAALPAAENEDNLKALENTVQRYEDKMIGFEERCWRVFPFMVTFQGLLVTVEKFDNFCKLKDIPAYLSLLMGLACAAYLHRTISLLCETRDTSIRLTEEFNDDYSNDWAEDTVSDRIRKWNLRQINQRNKLWKQKGYEGLRYLPLIFVAFFVVTTFICNYMAFSEGCVDFRAPPPPRRPT